MLWLLNGKWGRVGLNRASCGPDGQGSGPVQTTPSELRAQNRADKCFSTSYHFAKRRSEEGSRIDRADINLLRVFAAVVEAGGFSPAQSGLNLSLPTISGRIRDLEIRLGMQLCRRGRTGFALTDEGAVVYDEAQRLFAVLEGFDRRIQGLRSALTGQITLGLTDNTLTDSLAPIEAVLARYCDKAPEVVVTVVTKPPNELLRDLLAGHIQVAVASFPRQALGLAYDDLYTEAQLFYCGRTHPLFDRAEDTIDISEIRTHRLVARSYWGARDLKVFAIPTPRAVVSDMEAEARLILSGRFLGYLPEHFARRFVQEGRMRPIRPDLFGYRAVFQVAYNPEKARRPVVAMMIQTILTELRAG